MVGDDACVSIEIASERISVITRYRLPSFSEDSCIGLGPGVGEGLFGTGTEGRAPRTDRVLIHGDGHRLDDRKASEDDEGRRRLASPSGQPMS